MNAKPQAEHEWLMQFVGEWNCESECPGEPGKPPTKMTGTESVRSLGGLWMVSEGTFTGTESGSWKSITTLGYDPQAKAFVGTFIATMMTHLWPYRGSLNAEKTVLTLDSEGPSFSGDGTMQKYQDIVTVVSKNHRILTSQVQGPDGKWTQFMKMDAFRKA